MAMNSFAQPQIDMERDDLSLEGLHLDGGDLEERKHVFACRCLNVRIQTDVADQLAPESGSGWQAVLGSEDVHIQHEFLVSQLASASSASASPLKSAVPLSTLRCINCSSTVFSFESPTTSLSISSSTASLPRPPSTATAASSSDSTSPPPSIRSIQLPASGQLTISPDVLYGSSAISKAQDDPSFSKTFSVLIQAPGAPYPRMPDLSFNPKNSPPPPVSTGHLSPTASPILRPLGSPTIRPLGYIGPGTSPIPTLSGALESLLGPTSSKSLSSHPQRDAQQQNVLASPTLTPKNSTGQLGPGNENNAAFSSPSNDLTATNSANHIHGLLNQSIKSSRSQLEKEIHLKRQEHEHHVRKTKVEAEILLARSAGKQKGGFDAGGAVEVASSPGGVAKRRSGSNLSGSEKLGKRTSNGSLLNGNPGLGLDMPLSNSDNLGSPGYLRRRGSVDLTNLTNRGGEGGVGEAAEIAASLSILQGDRLAREANAARRKKEKERAAAVAAAATAATASTALAEEEEDARVREGDAAASAVLAAARSPSPVQPLPEAVSHRPATGIREASAAGGRDEPKDREEKKKVKFVEPTMGAKELREREKMDEVDKEEVEVEDEAIFDMDEDLGTPEEDQSTLSDDNDDDLDDIQEDVRNPIPAPATPSKNSVLATSFTNGASSSVSASASYLGTSNVATDTKRLLRDSLALDAPSHRNRITGRRMRVPRSKDSADTDDEDEVDGDVEDETSSGLRSSWYAASLPIGIGPSSLRQPSNLERKTSVPHREGMLVPPLRRYSSAAAAVPGPSSYIPTQQRSISTPSRHPATSASVTSGGSSMLSFEKVASSSRRKPSFTVPIPGVAEEESEKQVDENDPVGSPPETPAMSAKAIPVPVDVENYPSNSTAPVASSSFRPGSMFSSSLTAALANASLRERHGFGSSADIPEQADGTTEESAAPHVDSVPEVDEDGLPLELEDGEVGEKGFLPPHEWARRRMGVEDLLSRSVHDHD